MTGTALIGTDLDLTLDGSIVASAREWSIDPQRDMVEITTLGSGRSRVYKPNHSGYTLSISGLVFRDEGSTQIGYLDLLNKMLNSDTSIVWEGSLDSSTSFASGWGYISSAPVQFPQDGGVSYSLDVQGCGDITINTTL